MTGEECIKLFNDLELRRYIIKRAQGRAKTDEDVEDYVQEAWLRIWERCEAGQEFECYCLAAKRAIKAAYERNRYHRFPRNCQKK